VKVIGGAATQTAGNVITGAAKDLMK